MSKTSKTLGMLFGAMLCTTALADPSSWFENSSSRRNNWFQNTSSSYSTPGRSKHATKVSVSGDYLYGIIVCDDVPVIVFADNHDPANSQIVDMPYGYDTGYRIGLGIERENDFQLRGRWTFLPSSKEFASTYTVVVEGNGPSDTNDALGVFPSFSVDWENEDPGTYEIEVATRNSDRLRMVDLILGGSNVIAFHHLRVQLFGGLKYLKFDQHLESRWFQTSGPSLDRNSSHTISDSLKGTGVQLGADIFYDLSKSFFVFSTLTSGMLVGSEKVDLIFEDITSINGKGSNAQPLGLSYDTKTRMAPWLEMKFGFGNDFKLGKAARFTLRAFYEMFYLKRTSENASTVAILTAGGVVPFDNSVIQATKVFFATRMLQTQVFGLQGTLHF